MASLPQSALTIKEMRSGIIILYCRTCKDSTKHQTIASDNTRYYLVSRSGWRKIKKGEPYKAHSTFNSYGYCSYPRKCQVCGSIQKF